VHVYPNPSLDGNVTLGFDVKTDENIGVKIFSADGRLVYTDEIFCPADSHTALPVRLDEATAAAGYYILQVTSSTAILRQRIVVMRNH
ncbi:MAG TPA: T9SS type A sorting domain-containing protein, partial [Bacteroidia bacterium]|nr:T9SS type A sorting domain-containing protein [Bacteroidia bacterium]